jgi:hypothetical protein
MIWLGDIIPIVTLGVIWLVDYIVFIIGLDDNIAVKFGVIALLDHNINVIIWLYDNIDVIIWFDDNILLFNRIYRLAGIIDVSSDRTVRTGQLCQGDVIIGLGDNIDLQKGSKAAWNSVSRKGPRLISVGDNIFLLN